VTPNPQTTPSSAFFNIFYIFIAGEYRGFKFGMQVDHIKSQPMDDKLSLKGVVTSRDTILNF